METIAQPLGQKSTKRQILAQLLICSGCCCGRTEKGRPPVPLDWLKQEWKRRQLKPHVQLTISGCLGPCDLANIVALLTTEGQIWLGGISEYDTYVAIMDWASTTADMGFAAPLPPILRAHVIDRFKPITKTEYNQLR